VQIAHIVDGQGEGGSVSVAVHDYTTTGLRAEGRWFYIGMALVCALIAFLGFLPTYWLPMAQRTLDVAPVVHLHGIVFYTWTLFLVMQTSLVASGRTAIHRQTGKLGVAIAALMVVTGVLVAGNSVAVARADGFADQAHAFSIIPLSAILFFAVVVAIAVANVRRPDIHKRLMLLATITILGAPIARWFLVTMAPADAVGPPPVMISVFPSLITNLLLAVAVLHDWRRHGRVHRAYVYGFTALVALQVLRIPVSQSSAWHSFVGWLFGV
jgi:hypothetical protein